MKRLALILLALLALPSYAHAQCNGVFPNNTVCGNLTGSGNLPRPTSPSAFLGAAGGLNGEIQYNNGGALGGLTNIQVTARIQPFTSALSGAVPASGGGTTNWLRADGTWSPLPTPTYLAPWTNAVSYTQSALNANIVYATDYMGTTRCDGTIFNGSITTTTLTVSGVIFGTLATGHRIGGGTFGGNVVTYGTTITGQLTGTPGGAGTYSVSISQSVTATAMKGGTNQYTNLQNFLTTLNDNRFGSSITGIFPTGLCFVSTNASEGLALTVTGSEIVRQYHLLGYGSTISLDPSAVMSGLRIERGVTISHADEQTGVTVEGLTVDGRNNAVVVNGIYFEWPRTTLIRNQIYGGSDGVVIPYGNMIGIHGAQADLSNPDTGPFYSRWIGNVIKGNGVGANAFPVCFATTGQVNALHVTHNTCNEATYGFRVFNACASVTVACAGTANGVTITSNDWENLAFGIDFHATVPTLVQMNLWQIHDNRVENVTVWIDMSSVTQQSSFPMFIGPNMIVGVGTYLSNGNNIRINMLDIYQGQVTIDAGSLGANTTAILGTTTVNGAVTTMFCAPHVAGDLFGLQITCHVSSANIVTFRITNATTTPQDLGPLVYMATVRYKY